LVALGGHVTSSVNEEEEDEEEEEEEYNARWLRVRCLRRQPPPPTPLPS
jgi:hypothetical protein